MMRPLFITGTGTDIGKTHILCEMLTAYRQAGNQARVLKPVASGFDPDDLNATDTIRLMRANGEALTGEGLQAVTPWRFRTPISPDMAARQENRELRLENVAAWCLDRIDRALPTVIEGAGGVMSPIAENGLNLDLIRELDARPVLVAGAYLGTISHTLCALRVLDGHCTVIINAFGDTPVPVDDTVRVLQRFAPRADVRVFRSGEAPALLDLFEQARAAASDDI